MTANKGISRSYALARLRSDVTNALTALHPIALRDSETNMTSLIL